jgi:hypothetical protein
MSNLPDSNIIPDNITPVPTYAFTNDKPENYFSLPYSWAYYGY